MGDHQGELLEMGQQAGFCYIQILVVNSEVPKLEHHQLSTVQEVK